MSLVDLFEQLAGTPGRNDKAEILKAQRDPRVQQAFLLTYDWERTYGIHVTVDDADDGAGRAKPLFGQAVGQDPWDGFVELLDRLARRELTGQAAKAAWDGLAGRLSGRERRWYGRILNRDLKVGVDRKTVQATWPDLIRAFGVQLAHELKGDPDQLDRGPTKREPWATWPVLVEPKLDGMRVILDYRAESRACQAFSREGHALPNVQPFADELAAHLAGLQSGSCLVDSEAFASDWNETMSLVKREDVDPAVRDRLRFYCFDIVLQAAEGMTLQERRVRLGHVLSGGPARFVRLAGTIANDRDELMAQYNAALDRGHEGVMVKFLDAPYVRKRTNAWLKVKPVATVDAEILEVLPGEPDSRHAGRLGAFSVKRLDTGVRCNVGGGLTDAQRDEFWAQRDQLVGQVLEFREQAGGPVGAARFPRFIRMRPDRTA